MGFGPQRKRQPSGYMLGGYKLASDKLSLALRSGIAVLLFTVLISQVGIPSPKAALDSHNVAEKFLSVLLEARVDGQSNSIRVTQTFVVKTNHEKIKHGLILKFPTYDRTYKPPIGPMSYQFLKASIQSQAVSSDGKPNSEFPITNLSPEPTSEGLSLKVGNPTVDLSPGIFKFTIEYKVNNSIFSLNDSHEGVRIGVAKPQGFIADEMRAVFYPPAMVTQDSITASALVEALVKDGEKSVLTKTGDVAVTVGGDSKNLNVAGEPIPFVASNAKRLWGPEENMVLRVAWPKGFVLKDNQQINK